VILYELLTSRRPYKVKTDAPAEMLRAICDQEPERLSAAITRQEFGREANPLTAETIAADRGTLPVKLQRQLRGDLDAIVAKVLRKEPHRRYQSVEQLSEDLRRHLAGLPVSAHSGTWRYRTDKFIRRNKAGVAAVALIALSLLGGIVTTSWQARIARAERANALQQFNDVRTLTTSFLFEFHTAIASLPGSTPARQLLVQRALEYLNKLTQQAHEDAGLQRELAEAYLKIGDVQGNPYVANLGDTEGAAKSYDQALAISDRLARRNANDTDARRYLARSYQSLGEVLPVLGKPTDGLADLRRALELMQAMVAADPHNQTLQSELASCYQVLGDLQGHSGVQNLGDPAGALTSYNQALEIYRAQITANPGNKDDARGMAVVEMRIGDIELSRGDLKTGLNRYRSALRVLEKVSASDPTNADARRLLALSYQKIGGVNEETNLKEAFANYNRAATINEELLKADPNNAQANMNLAITLRYTGDLQAKHGDEAHALVNYQRVLQILERLANAEPKNVLLQGRFSEMLAFTADLLARRGELDEARRMTSRSLAITRQLASREDATSDDLYTYAENFLTCTPVDLREPATALEYAKRSVEKSGAKDSDSLDLLARAYFENGDAVQAMETEQKALSLLPPSQNHESASSPRHRMELQLARFKIATKHR
jgi:eukaryotic-like serine/threonine-protein kinase